jgi:hypothetical protein
LFDVSASNGAVDVSDDGLRRPLRHNTVPTNVSDLKPPSRCVMAVRPP